MADRPATGVPHGHTNDDPANGPVDGLGMLDVRARLLRLLAEVEGVHRGCVDLAVTVVAIAQTSPNPTGYATSAACQASAVATGRTNGLPHPVAEPLIDACQEAAATALAEGVRLREPDRTRWLDQPMDWDPTADSWTPGDGSCDRPEPDLSLPDSWVLRQPLWKWLLAAAIVTAVANGW